jgi:hypothetical protein
VVAAGCDPSPDESRLMKGRLDVEGPSRRLALPPTFLQIMQRCRAA